jgi:multiple sugar transport system ATP-binding protein
MAEVILKNVSKIYDGDVVAVKDVNLDIKDKEFAVLVGPSGCGKSTTLRMVAGLEEITEGEILIDGKVVNNIQPKDRDIAMVFQNYALYPHMTVEENMAFGLKLRKLPKKEIKERVSEAAEILGLTEYLARKPKALSGGQRQRVAIGRVIVRKPKVFLFDEPLSNLDAKLRVQMRAEIIKLHSKLQVTSIYVTHDQIEAMTMGTMIVVMNNRLVQQVGSPLDVYKSPNNRFVAGFIGSPPMNFISAEVREKDKAYYLDCGDYQLKLPSLFNEYISSYVGKKVVFGIRPGDIYDKSLYPGQIDGNVVSANVEVVEHLGAEEYVYFATGKTSFTAKYDPSLILHIGDKNKEVVFEMKNANIFDAESERTIIC